MGFCRHNLLCQFRGTGLYADLGTPPGLFLEYDLGNLREEFRARCDRRKRAVAPSYPIALIRDNLVKSGEFLGVWSGVP